MTIEYSLNPIYRSGLGQKDDWLSLGLGLGQGYRVRIG